MIQVGAGYEYQVTEVTVPRTNDASARTHAADRSRSGARTVISIDGIRYTGWENDSLNVRFIPLYFVVDTRAQGDGFGRVVGYDGSVNPIRKVVGALVEMQVTSPFGRPDEAKLRMRSKLASFEYDRDRGFWDIRFLEVGGGVTRAWKSPDGSVSYNLDLSVGMSAGMVSLNQYSAIEQALQSGGVQNAATINPFALFALGAESKDVRVSWTTRAEGRFSSGSRGTERDPQFPEINSGHIVSALDVQYTFPRTQISLYANAAYEYDSLTLSHVLFGTNDSFHSFLLTGGVRGRF